LGQAARALSLLVAGLALYRSAIFIHEIVHMREGAVPYFRPVWNLLTGVPLLIPSFFYEDVHLSHHRKDFYGTDRDGEYFPFARSGHRFIALFFLANLLFPLVLLFRHLVLVPLSLVSHTVREWTWKHVSSLEVNLTYVRPVPASGVSVVWEEILACLFCAAAGVALYGGYLSPQWIYVWYAMAALLLTVNGVRTLVAHRYELKGESAVNPTEQYLDSIDIPGNLFTALWAPVGLRFHATHHLFPGLPYHSLQPAYWRLHAGLVENRATFQRATSPSLGRALAELWRESGRACAAPRELAED
jgi:fatty acid desaturase